MAPKDARLLAGRSLLGEGGAGPARAAAAAAAAAAACALELPLLLRDGEALGALGLPSCCCLGELLFEDGGLGMCFGLGPCVQGAQALLYEYVEQPYLVPWSCHRSCKMVRGIVLCSCLTAASWGGVVGYHVTMHVRALNALNLHSASMSW